jgi:hypothetical protein
MSTLVPGSEPWQIAEPLEYAADIWKALEEKYGPKSGDQDGNLVGCVHENGSPSQTEERGWQDKFAGGPPPVNDGLAQEVSDGLQEVAELWTREQDKEIERSNAANTTAIEEIRKWNDDHMRDQRFLWALLNGGKDEELGQTNGKNDRAVGAGG